MEKFIKYLVLLIAFLPLVTNAEELNNFNIITGESVETKEDVNGSSIVVGTNVTTNNKVKGIDVLFGETIEYNGNSDYALLMGLNVNVLGNINNDGVILGDVVTFDSKMTSNRDMFIFASSVTLSGTFNRDVVVYANTVYVDNINVLGNLDIKASNIEIKDNSIISGELSYNEDTVISLSNKATIGEVKLTEKLIEEYTFQETMMTIIVDYCSYLVVFLAIALIIPKLFKKIENTNEDFNLMNLFSSLGFGVFALILIPVIFIVLCSFTIGVQLAILLLILYIVIIWLAPIFTGYLLGYMIWKKFIKKDQNVLLIGLVGMTILTILNNIPVIGTIISAASLMIGVGLFIRTFMNGEQNN